MVSPDDNKNAYDDVYFAIKRIYKVMPIHNYK